MSAPVSMVQRKAQDGGAYNLVLTGGTALDYSFDPAMYNQLLIISDAANTTPVCWKSNASTNGSDPTLPTVTGAFSRFVEVGAAILLTMHEAQVLRFKSSANATLRLMAFSSGNHTT